MYSPAKPRVTLAANRSTSLNAIAAPSEPSTSITNSARRSSNDLMGSPKTTRHSSGFTPAHPRYEVNSEMLITARKSMDAGKSIEGKGKGTNTPPPKGQRSLPPLPPLPSHAQVKSPPLPPRNSPITRPTSVAPVSPPTSPEPHAHHSHPASSPVPSPATPASFAPPAPFASPASPVLASATASASPPLPPSSTPLSPQLNRPLPATPKKRPSSLLPRAATSPDFSGSAQTSKENVQPTQTTHDTKDQVTCEAESTDITKTSEAQTTKTNQTLQIVLETQDSQGKQIQEQLHEKQEIRKSQEVQSGGTTNLKNSQTLVSTSETQTMPITSDISPLTTNPQIIQSVQEIEQESKKDVKYYSNPEPAVSSKDGLVHRHLSAPSSVLSESQLIENASVTQEIHASVSLTKSRSAPFSGKRDSNNANIEIVRVSSSLAKSSDSITQDNNLRRSGEIQKEANTRRGSADMADNSGLRSSVELSGDANPNLRSWYLKKNSMQKQEKRPIPKEIPEYRKCRKELPELPEITQKNKIIKEIFTTEATYVDDLCVAIKVYKEPISRYKWVSDEDVVAMFQNIEQLYLVNKALFSSMLEIVPKVVEFSADDSPCPPLGEVFLRHLDKFSCYTTYLCNKELSTRVVKKLENMSHFSTIISECKQNRECQGLGLADFLIKPVQRLCKYPLLFKELRKYLSSSDPQLPVLNDVISAVEELASITNQTITNTEKLSQIRKLMGNDIAPYLENATVVREGTVIVITKSKKEESFFWLLDSAILWHPTKATLRKVVKSSKPSKTSKPKNVLQVSSIAAICGEEYEHHKHSFSLKYKYSDTKEKRVVFCAQSYLEKLCWIDDIKAQLTH